MDLPPPSHPPPQGMPPPVVSHLIATAFLVRIAVWINPHRTGQGQGIHGEGAARREHASPGWGPVVRHDAVRDAVAKWLRDRGYQAYTEQHVPRWDIDAERACLDVSCTDQRGDLVHLDVTLVVTANATADGPVPQLERRTSPLPRCWTCPTRLGCAWSLGHRSESVGAQCGAHCRTTCWRGHC